MLFTIILYRIAKIFTRSKKFLMRLARIPCFLYNGQQIEKTGKEGKR